MLEYNDVCCSPIHVHYSINSILKSPTILMFGLPVH